MPDLCNRCKLPEGAEFKVNVNGEDYEMDPCLYKTTDYFTNCTVEVCRCSRCGHIDFTWHKTPNTERIDPDEMDGVPI